MLLAFVSDIHEDFHSLNVAINKIKKLSCDKIICLGDISGSSVPHYDFYKYRDANACLDLIRKSCDIVIIGNHDLHAASILPKNSNFKYPDNWYELNYWEKRKICDNQLWLYEENELNPKYNNENLSFLKSLPEFHIYKTENYNLFLSHYLAPNLTGSDKSFHFDWKDYSEHFELLQSNNCRYSFCGHAHIVGHNYIHNNKIHNKKLGKKHVLRKGGFIIVPAIVKVSNKNGFLVFDTIKEKVRTYRI